MVFIVWQNRARLFTPIFRQSVEKKIRFKIKKIKQINLSEWKRTVNRVYSRQTIFANRFTIWSVAVIDRVWERSDAINSIQINENDTKILTCVNFSQVLQLNAIQIWNHCIAKWSQVNCEDFWKILYGKKNEKRVNCNISNSSRWRDFNQLREKIENKWIMHQSHQQHKVSTT